MGLIVEDSDFVNPDKKTFIDLNSPVNFNISSLDDLKSAVKKTGLQYGKETLSRGRGVDLSDLLKFIEDLEDKEIYEEYFIKISNLISKYKSGSLNNYIQKTLKPLNHKLNLLFQYLRTQDFLKYIRKN